VRPLIFLLLALTACTNPTADEVLERSDAATAETALAQRGESLQATVNLKARSARDAARARPNDADAQVAAARSMFVAADLELRRSLIAELDRKPAGSPDQLLDREDDLPGDLKSRVVALSEAGAGYARAAIALDGERPDARFFYAACLGLSAWGKGAAAALLQGLAPKVKQAIEDAVAADPTFADGAPLGALGAFYSRAPWPVGDKAKAKEALLRAGEGAMAHLYLAELCWRTGERQDAVRHWKQLATAEPDTISVAGPFIREFARRAVVLAAE
jgi:hypothetical protein